MRDLFIMQGANIMLDKTDKLTLIACLMASFLLGLILTIWG